MRKIAAKRHARATGRIHATGVLALAAHRCHKEEVNPNASDSVIRAVLGPTTTGETHLAIERMTE
ncbi:MAG: hypothetical protein A3J40_03765 [Erythrobacter sp. RIFCSPHIGHO2_12_FULL_63_10]|nr:MAG: hypothetical protein A3J40_03765 [Erythrobacter sp. RIFCSPHIGHO2_12_FULL_63_10]